MLFPEVVIVSLSLLFTNTESSMLVPICYQSTPGYPTFGGLEATTVDRQATV